MNSALQSTTAAAGITPAILSALAERHPGDLASKLRGREDVAVLAVLADLPVPAAVDVLRRLEVHEIGRLLLATDATRREAWLARLDPVRVAVVLGSLSAADAEALTALLPKALAQEVHSIRSFPAGTAGSLMDPRFSTFAVGQLVHEALVKVREFGGRRVPDLMLVNDDGRFAGVVRLQDLVGADADARLSSVRNPDAPTVLPMAHRDEVLALLETHRLSSLPVVDHDGQILGTIRYDGLVAAAKQDALGNLQQMVGASSEEGALSKARVGVRSRLPWLMINLITAFLAASVVGLFEDTIARVTALAVMLPIVAGQSGNTGAQALAVTMRGLALREIRARHLPKLLRKELMVGSINGLAVAIVTSAGIALWSRNFWLAVVMFASMVASMVIASMAGAIIPVVLVKLKRDPAVASSILLTTVTDVCGFFSFLGLATLLARLL